MELSRDSLNQSFNALQTLVKKVATVHASISDQQFMQAFQTFPAKLIADKLHIDASTVKVRLS